MNKPMSTPVSRTLAVLLSVVLVYSPLFPAVIYAQTVSGTEEPNHEQIICERNSGTWNGTSCDMPVPPPPPAPDTTPPVIAPHDDVSAQATSADGVAVIYIRPTASDDVDSAVTVSCTPHSGIKFAIGTTTVTCTATDAAGNSATATTFNVIVQGLPEPEVPPAATSTEPIATTTPDIATSTPDVATSTPDTGSTPSTGSGQAGSPQAGSPQAATTTPPIDTGTGTTTDSGTGDGSGGTPPTPDAGTPPPDDPSTVSDSSTSSGVVDPSQSDTDNTDFENITDGPTDPCALRPCTVLDKSATTTEMAAVVPQFLVATSTDGTGSKIGGTIFTGSASASTTVKNILNITRSNVDGPGETNSSKITANTDNVGDVTTIDDTRAFTGDNRGLGGEGTATIHTGQANASARVLNIVNTNFFNSEGQVLFLNPEGSDGLDLRDADLAYFIDGGVGAAPAGLGCTILTCLNSATLKVLNTNEGTADNDVYVRAATGENVATSTKEGSIDIKTGNAYASAAVLNMVNTNFINSKYLVATYDNFGNMQGDIVLPSASFFRTFFENGNTLPSLQSSSYIVSNDNDEMFTGTTTANAITGQNVATTTPSTSSGQAALGHGEIRTGQARTSSTSFTAANQTYVGGASVLFVFHVSGSIPADWRAHIKGLPDGMSVRKTEYGIEIYSNGAVGSTRGPQGIYNSANFIASSTNKAIVNTDVNVWAETGENRALTENGTGSITTGDAYAIANVVNMVNTNVVNRNFMFAVFNIAGDWSGDIDFGGHSPNLKVTTTVVAPDPTIPGSDVTYHFTVANNSDVPADNVVLTTTYDKNLLLISRSDKTFADVPTGMRWNLGSVALGQPQQFVATGRVASTITGLPAGFSMTVPLNATVSSSLRDQDDADNTQRTTITVSSPTSTGGGSDSGSSGSGSGTSDPRDRGDRGGDTSSGGGGAPPPSGGGGGGAPPPSGGSSPSTGSGSSSGGDGGGGAPAPASGAGGVGGGNVLGATSQNNVAIGKTGSWTLNPHVRITKTASITKTTAPMNVDYKVVVSNDKQAGPAYTGVLTDILSDPKGGVVSNRSWNLDTIEPGDEITLTYTVAFGTSTVPGIYRNIARVTGFKNYAKLPYANVMDAVEARGSVEFLPNGLDSGSASSTVSFVSDATIQRTGSCAALLGSPLRPGSAGVDVTKLQSFLAGDSAVYPSGMVTGYFGSLTTAAVKSFQRKYADDILKPVGLSSPTGLVYSSTIRQINRLACGGVDPVAASGDIPAAAGAAVPGTPSKPKAPSKRTTGSAKPSPFENGGFLKTVGSWFTGFAPKQ